MPHSGTVTHKLPLFQGVRAAASMFVFMTVSSTGRP